jgi:hypothetical protein
MAPRYLSRGNTGQIAASNWIVRGRESSSSLRTQRPITPGAAWCGRHLLHHLNEMTRRMGPCVRRDDVGYCFDSFSKHTFPIPRHVAPESLLNFPPNRGRGATLSEGAGDPLRKGAGNAGCSPHPRPVCKGRKHTVVTTVAPEHPAFPHAMVLTAYAALSPATNSSCHRHRRISDSSKTRLGS